MKKFFSKIGSVVKSVGNAISRAAHKAVDWIADSPLVKFLLRITVYSGLLFVAFPIIYLVFSLIYMFIPFGIIVLLYGVAQLSAILLYSASILASLSEMVNEYNNKRILA